MGSSYILYTIYYILYTPIQRSKHQIWPPSLTTFRHIYSNILKLSLSIFKKIIEICSVFYCCTGVVSWTDDGWKRWKGYFLIFFIIPQPLGSVLSASWDTPRLPVSRSSRSLLHVVLVVFRIIRRPKRGVIGLVCSDYIRRNGLYTSRRSSMTEHFILLIHSSKYIYTYIHLITWHTVSSFEFLTHTPWSQFKRMKISCILSICSHYDMWW